MADKTIPYEVLKKVMSTCTDADYGRLSFALLQKEKAVTATSCGELKTHGETLGAADAVLPQLRAGLGGRSRGSTAFPPLRAHGAVPGAAVRPDAAVHSSAQAAAGAEEAVPPRLARLMKRSSPSRRHRSRRAPKRKSPRRSRCREPKPVDTRKKMENSAAMRAIKDELADLRDQVDTKRIAQQDSSARRSSKDARSERSLITSKVGSGSAGIVTANSSRGFGSGAGALSDHTTVGQLAHRRRRGREPRHPHWQQRQGRAQPGGDRIGVRSQQGRDLRAVHPCTARARRSAGQDGAAAHDLAGRRSHRLHACSAAN